MTTTPTPTTALATHIDVATLRERLTTEETPRILDVRTPAEFDTAHIPGSYNVPLDLLREHRKELSRHLDKDVVLVCRSGARATQAEHALTQTGLTGLAVLEGGMVGWEAAGGPVNRGRETWDLERQVRFTAGSLVATSVIGSMLTPRMKWVAAAIGTGLVGAAVTNTCAMGMALSKMPWNRGSDTPDIDAVIRALTLNSA